MKLKEYMEQLEQNTKAKEEAQQEIDRLNVLLSAAYTKRNQLNTDRLNLKRTFFGQAYAANSGLLTRKIRKNPTKLLPSTVNGENFLIIVDMVTGDMLGKLGPFNKGNKPNEHPTYSSLT